MKAERISQAPPPPPDLIQVTMTLEEAKQWRMICDKFKAVAATVPVSQRRHVFGSNAECEDFVYRTWWALYDALQTRR